MYGRSKDESDFAFSRLKKLFTKPLLPPAVASAFDRVNAAVRLSPCEYRFVTLICSESYQLFPCGVHRSPTFVYCGYGRRITLAKVALPGNPGYGSLNPRAITAALSI